MRAVFALLIVALAGVSAQVVQNICQPTEVVFLLDHSENALKGSTEDGGTNFEYLISAWQGYMRELQQRGDNIFRIWAWAYSSRAVPKELVQRNSRPSQCFNAPIGDFNSGGSWTYKGLEQLRNQRPSLPNNIVIIISAQGSMNADRRGVAMNMYNDLFRNGWRTYVIGVMSGQTIDSEELFMVNGNRQPVILDDNRTSNKKSYTLLPSALSAITNSILCPATTVTRPPIVTLPPIITRPPTRPPSTGICSNCQIEGGYGFDIHPTHCDLFYQCIPDANPVLKQCPQSLIWNNQIGTCVRTSGYSCAMGACNAGLIGTTYPSGVCCNHYFTCNGTHLGYTKCAAGTIYDENSRQCVNSANPVQACAARDSHYCNDQIVNDPIDCGAYAPDPLGSPCKFLHNGVSQMTAMGTMWDQNLCRLVLSDVCSNRGFGTRSLSTVSDRCNAILLSTFDADRPLAESPRDPSVKMHVRFMGAMRSQGSLYFNPNGDSRAYYYFFNNNEIAPDSAFRLVFQLDSSARSGVEYDLLSNNFCPECQMTMSVTVRKSSANACAITSSFMDNSTNALVRTTTQITNMQADGWLDYTVVWGVNNVHGVVKVMSSSKSVLSTVQIPLTQHYMRSAIIPNKCGIVLGGGPNTNFVGRMDEFAYYTSCANIDDILQ